MFNSPWPAFYFEPFLRFQRFNVYTGSVKNFNAFHMIFLYLPHPPVCWYGKFAVDIGHGFPQIYTD